VMSGSNFSNSALLFGQPYNSNIAKPFIDFTSLLRDPEDPAKPAK